MKKFILAMVAMLTISLSASAMSYEQAREQALFLTDKMAYELNLTDDQYEAAYEVNLDYLLGVNGYDDLYGIYWRQRNTDLSYILLDWQYRAYLNATYFYRPLYWDGGFFHFGIYARYPHRDYFFFGRPAFYASYRGAHAWHMNGGRSWYHGRQFGQPHPGGQQRIGMRDGFNQGNYGRGTSFGNMQRNSRGAAIGTSRNNQQPQQQGGRTYGSRQSSTRTTVNGNGTFGSQRRSSTYGGTTSPRSNNVFGGNRSTTTQRNSSTETYQRNSGSRVRSNSTGSSTTRSSGFTPRSTPSHSSFGSSNRSFGGSHSTGGGSSFGGGSRSTGGGGSHSSGGGFGGRR